MSDITSRQQRILDFIARTVRERGYPPTVREIGDAVGLTSSSSVHAQLANLERKGLAARRTPPSRGRCPLSDDRRAEGTPVPLIGRIAAGEPSSLTSTSRTTSWFRTAFVRGDGHFALRVAGDSMIGAGILDGDVVVMFGRPTIGERRRHRGRVPAGPCRRRGHGEATGSRRRAGDAHPREPGPGAVRDGRRAHPRQGGGGAPEGLPGLRRRPLSSRGTVRRGDAPMSAETAHQPRTPDPLAAGCAAASPGLREGPRADPRGRRGRTSRPPDLAGRNGHEPCTRAILGAGMLQDAGRSGARGAVDAVRRLRRRSSVPTTSSSSSPTPARPPTRSRRGRSRRPPDWTSSRSRVGVPRSPTRSKPCPRETSETYTVSYTTTLLVLAMIAKELGATR